MTVEPAAANGSGKQKSPPSGRVNTNFSTAYLFQAIAMALAGSPEEAKPVTRRALELEPAFCTRAFFELGMAPLLRDRLVEGARLLGLPE